MKLYVGNLALTLTENELADLFKAHGEVVSAKIITDRETGKSKGFGFVEMGTRSEGHKAMEDLNGKEYKYRTLVCNEAKPLKKKARHRR